MRIRLGKLKKIIREISGEWDSDVAPPLVSSRVSDSDTQTLLNPKKRREYLDDRDRFEDDSEAESAGRQAADAWLSSGTDIDADEWLETTITRNPELDPTLIRWAFDQKIG